MKVQMFKLAMAGDKTNSVGLKRKWLSRWVKAKPQKGDSSSRKAQRGIHSQVEALLGVNTNLVKDNWDDMLRLAGSLKLGVVQATSIMRTLRIDDRPTKLAQAVAELGRIDKTIHSLTYIDEESKRRRILTQLNRGEDRHKLARAVFHGKRGELRQRYREGQEDQLGALGLVVNVIILWNTLYIDAALQQLRAEGFPVQAEDVARLSPLVFEHINLLGRYAFSVPEAFQRGELRPLRNPSDSAGEVA